ncbi:MAG: hypothetical protein ACRYF4_01670 [Janthinobacterium lividum]
MIRRTVSALVLATTLFAPLASHASLFGSKDNVPTGTTTLKGKMVKMTLKNRTTTAMDLMVEDKPVTIAANGEYELKAVEGTHVYGADKAVKLLVTRDLNGTTCSFR